MPSRSAIRSRISRSAVLVLAVVALLSFTGSTWPAILLPGLSPYLMLMSALSLRAFTWVSLAAMPLLLVSLWRGRWFCRFGCPTGLCLDAVSRLGRAAGIASTRPLRFRPGTALLLLTAGGAATGFPLFLWLDPLVLFNGFAGIWTVPFTWTGAALGSGFSVLLLLSLFRPNQWCYGICPLGTIQQWLGNAGRHLRSRLRTSPVSAAATAAGPQASRRTALAMITGGVFGLLLRRALAHRQVLRPPGSVPDNQFGALCTRCGNCIRVCPEHILIPAGMDAGADALLTPVVRMKPGYCSEFCNRCNTVCPTGAIALLTLEQKREVAIGTAVVHRTKCLAWEDAKYCMVCDEFCPYSAIHTEEHRGVSCPVVDPELCRGCGLCQKECPALQTAIIVEPRPQRRLAPVRL